MAVARQVQRHRAGWRSAELIVQGTLIVILTVMLIYAAIMVIRSDVTTCDKTTAGSRAGVFLSVCALAGFVAGRGLGYLRKLIHEAPVTISASTSKPNGLVQGFLMFFLIGTTALLGYETFAVFQPNGIPPAITTYVRCAAAAGGWLSAAGAALVGLLLGNWLWYPTSEKPWRGIR